MLTAFVALSIILLILLYLVSNRKHRNALPPGPRSLPFLGNLLQVGPKPHLRFSQWAVQYGKLYTFYLANKPVLVVNDAKLLKQLFSMMPALEGFEKVELIKNITKGRYALGAQGKTRLEQRRFFEHAIRQFGLGQDPFKEKMIVEKVNELINWIKTEQTKNGKIYFNDILKIKTSNVIWAVCSGEKIDADMDSKIVALGQSSSKQLKAVVKSGLLFFPWLKYVAPMASTYNQFKNMSDEIYEYVENTFKQRISTCSKGNGKGPEHVIDAYIEKMDKCRSQNPRSSFCGESGMKHSVGAIAALFLAGSETPGMLLEWILFYLSALPHVQQKLQNEIKKVIGNRRTPSLEDKANMPYARAVIQEALRFASIVPFGVMHELTEDITFHGFELPKGLLLMANLYHVHFDKDIWGDPENFRPERFLGEEQRLKEFVVAFQPGKRTCPGQQVAVDLLFLFVTKLFQHFTFKVDHSAVKSTEEYLEPLFNISLEPKHLPVIATERQ